MRSFHSYIITALVAFSLTACVPPGADQGKGDKGGGLGGFQFVFLGLMIVVFWLFFIRPQQKRAKNQKKFIEDLQRGDKIVTIAGIHGTINKVNEDGTINVEISPGSYIKIEKSAISMEWTAALNKVTTTPEKK
jgi:preprotein translocase subunit YajC